MSKQVNDVLSNVGSGASIDEQLKLAQLEDLLEKQAEKKSRKDLENAQRKAAALNKQALEALRLATQSQCDHRKPNGQPSIGGQRDHQNHTLWLCLKCQKNWVDGQLPGPLRVGLDSNRIGGPSL